MQKNKVVDAAYSITTQLFVWRGEEADELGDEEVESLLIGI